MKRKIGISPIELAAIIAALNEFGMATFGAEMHDRFVAADPANDGPETTILMRDFYTIKAREWGVTRAAAKMRVWAEGVGLGQ